MTKLTSYHRYNELNASQFDIKEFYQLLITIWDNHEEELAARLALVYLYGLRCSEGLDVSYQHEIDLPEPYNIIHVTRFPMKVKELYSVEDGNDTIRLYLRAYRCRKGKPRLNRLKEKYIDDYKKIREEYYNRIKPLPLKNIPVIIQFRGVETEDTQFAELLERYLDEYLPQQHNLNLTNWRDQKLHKELTMFSHDTKWFKNHLPKYLKNFSTPFSWHSLRKIRATKLQNETGFSVPEAMYFFGWQTPSVAVNYAQSDEYGILRKFEERLQAQLQDKVFDKELYETQLQKIKNFAE